MLKRISGVLAALLAFLALATAQAAASAADDEAETLARINASRAARGLGPLTVNAALAAHARRHSSAMAQSGGLFHSSAADLQAAAGPGWAALAETVGRGSDIADIHAAFMASPSHRKNILGDFDYTGVGVAEADGLVYVTVVFMSTAPTSQQSPKTSTPAREEPSLRREPTPPRPSFPEPCHSPRWVCQPRPI